MCPKCARAHFWHTFESLLTLFAESLYIWNTHLLSKSLINEISCQFRGWVFLTAKVGIPWKSHPCSRLENIYEFIYFGPKRLKNFARLRRAIYEPNIILYEWSGLLKNIYERIIWIYSYDHEFDGKKSFALRATSKLEISVSQVFFKHYSFWSDFKFQGIYCISFVKWAVRNTLHENLWFRLYWLSLAIQGGWPLLASSERERRPRGIAQSRNMSGMLPVIGRP